MEACLTPQYISKTQVKLMLAAAPRLAVKVGSFLFSVLLLHLCFNGNRESEPSSVFGGLPSKQSVEICKKIDNHAKKQIRGGLGEEV